MGIILKKGSFQVSLSMIIGVVFAVVILGLAISWITGSFSGVTKISDKALASAEGSLQQGVVDKSLLLFARNKIRIDQEIEGAVVVRNKLFKKAYFKVDIVPPNDPPNMFDVVGKEGILTILPDEIKEHKFAIKGNKDVLSEYLGSDKEKPVRFEYKIYVCTDKDDPEKCGSKDWEYYDSGNTILTVTVTAG